MLCKNRPLHRMFLANTRSQLRLGDWEMTTSISCTKCSQVTSLIHTWDLCVYLSELNDTVELHRVYVLRNLGIVLRILRILKLSRQSRDCVTHVYNLEIV